MDELHAAGAPQDPLPGSLPPHTRIDHYEVLAEIGRGGMGVVYRARDTVLGRLVALKCPWIDTDREPGQRRRLLREARAAAQLAHPHVVPIFEVLEHEGVPWIAMELVTGSTLRGLIRGSGALPIEDVLRHAEGLADALAAAHSKNILHRDVSPNNVLVDSRGRVLLTDFGLAQFVSGPANEDNTTVSGQGDLSGAAGRMVGTPGYTSPEQVRGEWLDGRSDIFALGAVLYEMCTGQRAFPGQTRGEIGEAILHRRPDAISTSDERPDALIRIIGKALAKSREDRYQTAGDLAADVRILRRRIEYERHSDADAAPPHRRSARAWISAVAATALITAAYLAYTYARRPQAPHRASLLITDFENATGDPIFDETVAEGLSVALDQSRSVSVFPRDRMVDVLRRMRRPPDSRIDLATGREICQRENLDILVDGSIRRSGNVIQIRAHALEAASGTLVFAATEQFEAREELFGRVDALARRVRRNLGDPAPATESGTTLEKATTRSLEALQLYSRARRLRALGDKPGAVTLLKGAIGIDQDFAMALLHLGSILGGDGDLTSAKEYLDRAYALRGDITSIERLQIEAEYYNIHGNYDKHLATLETMVAAYPADLRARRELALAYDDAGDPRAAARELRVALQLDPLDAETYSALALRLVILNSPAEALALIKQAERRGLNAPDFHRSAGLALLSRGETDAARDEFNRLESAGPFYTDIGQLYLARLALFEGRLGEADERLSSGLRRDTEQGNEVYAALRHNLRARVRWLTGDSRGAREDLKTIAAISDPTFGPYQLTWAGRLWAEMGEEGEARRLLATLRRLSGDNPDRFERACLRTLMGDMALAAGDAASGLEHHLAAAADYPMYEATVGVARDYVAKKQWAPAVAAWQDVLVFRGKILRDGDPADLALAELELGRAYRNLGDPTHAREHYAKFFRTWPTASDSKRRRTAVREAHTLGLDGIE
jgi:tetratricopeptide (TPR) repeat protein